MRQEEVKFRVAPVPAKYQSCPSCEQFEIEQGVYGIVPMNGGCAIYGFKEGKVMHQCWRKKVDHG